MLTLEIILSRTQIQTDVALLRRDCRREMLVSALKPLSQVPQLEAAHFTAWVTTEALPRMILVRHLELK
jgi:hypothetical protein